MKRLLVIVSVLFLSIGVWSQSLDAIRVNKTFEACGKYEFMGISYNQTGIYIDTAKSVKGLDSIVTLQLTINPFPAVPTVATTDFFNCSNDAHYKPIEAVSLAPISWYEHLAVGVDTVIGKSEPKPGTGDHSFIFNGAVVSREVYGVVVEKGCKSESKHITLTVMQAPQPRIDGFDTLFAPIANIKYTAVNVHKGDSLYWHVTRPYVLYQEDSSIISINFIVPTTDTIKFTEWHTNKNLTCSTTVTKTVVVLARVAQNITAAAEAKLFPNPTNGRFVVELPDSKAATAMLSVVSAGGEQWSYPVIVSDGRIVVDKQFAAGTYTVSVTTTDAVFSANIDIQ